MSGSPRSPARCRVARLCAVTSAVPWNTRSSSVSCFPGSATGSCAANAVTSASAKPHRIGGILAPRAIVFSLVDVYLIPVGPARHELYCEVPDEVPDENEGDGIGQPPGGFFSRVAARWSPRAIFRRVRAQFREMLAEAERERRQGRADNTA